MAHRDRCMPGVFSRILGHFGVVKDPQAAAKASSELEHPHPSKLHPGEAEVSNGQPPNANQKPREHTHMSTFNVVWNKDVSYNKRAAEKKALAGFRVSIAVPVDCEPCTPVVVECTSGSGGVQGLQWYSEKLMVDEDGDVAQEFLDEVILQASGPQVGYTRLLSSFKAKLKTRPAKLKGPVCTYDGNVVQTVESFICRSK